MKNKQEKTCWDMTQPPVTVSTSPTHISAHCLHGGIRISMVEADTVDGETWWIVRALVHATAREHGLGSLLLRAVIDAIKAQPGARRVQVTPGGYWVDPERQVNFYRKNGFKPTEEEGLLEVVF